MNYPRMLNTIMIKINGQNRKQPLLMWRVYGMKSYQMLPFQYNFLEEKYDKLYETETKFGLVIKFAALFSIVIACLGLFGMVSYTSERRKKEIGIRKSNGASAADILMLLNTGIVKWVGIASILAIPIAYYATDKWLQDFAYRTPVNMVFLF